MSSAHIIRSHYTKNAKRSCNQSLPFPIPPSFPPLYPASPFLFPVKSLLNNPHIQQNKSSSHTVQSIQTFDPEF